MYRSVFDPRRRLHVLFNFSVLGVTLQKRTANLYASLIGAKDSPYKTRTLFVIDSSQPSAIPKDFSAMFLREKTPNFVPTRNLDLPVTGSRDNGQSSLRTKRATGKRTKSAK